MSKTKKTAKPKRKGKSKPGPPKGRKKKAEQGIVAMRTAVILEFLVDAVPRCMMVQYGADEWGIKARQVDNYISKANAKLAEVAAYRNDAEVGAAIRRYRAIYYAAMAATSKDLTAAKGAQDSLCRLLGLNVPEQLRVVHNTDGLATMTEHELLDLYHKGKNGGDIPDLTSTGSRPN